MGRMKIILAVMMMAVLVAGCQVEAQGVQQTASRQPGENKVMVASDIHHLATSLKDDGKAFTSFVAGGDGKLLQYTDELMEVFVSEVKVERPDFVVLSGDLTNNGEMESHKELAGYLAEIEAAGIQVYVIPGNHDVRNPFALGFEGDQRKRVESVEPSDFETIYRDFGYMEAISKDPNSLSYLAQPTKELAILMLDTNRYERNLEIGVPNASGQVREETLAWMKDALKMTEGTEVIAVMHHNATIHSEMFVDNYVIDNTDVVMQALKDQGVEVVLTGHIHIQDLVQDEATGIHDLTTTSMSVYPQRVGILTITEEVYRYETEDLPVEIYAKEHGWKDPSLLNFADFSKSDFAGRAKEMLFSQLPTNTSAEEREAMGEAMAALNLAYFAGEEADQKSAIKEMKGYAALREIKSPFLQHYFESILQDETNDNAILIEREES